ncbi:MAG: metal-sensitive transcriptional regulator [bacterium]|nr:metal-sensitive transcriptional regulator [bacterium]
MQDKYKNQAIARLHRLQGQMRGLEKMVEAGKYCPEILTQSSAIQKSLAGFNQLIMENHLREHIVHQMKGKKDEQAIVELMRIYKLSNPTA